MAGPITWRSLQPTADANTAAQLLLSSQKSINAAFDPFQKILDQQAAFAGQQAAGVREGNKQTFLDALAGAKSPEELAALQASGRLDTMRANLTPENAAAVRGADEARLAGLRQQTVAGQQFNDGQQLRGQKELEDTFAQMVASGEYDSAQGLLDANPQVVNKGVLQNSLVLARRAQTDRDWSLTQRGHVEADAARKVADDLRKGQMHTVDIATKTSATAAHEAAAEASKSARELAQQQMAAARANAMAEAQTRFLKESGNVYSDGVFTPNDTQALNELMVKNGIGNDADARSAIIERLSKLGGEIEVDYVDGKNKLAKRKVPIPLSAVKQAILGASGGFLWNTDNDFADSAEENLKKAMRQVSEQRLPDGRAYKQNKSVFDFDQYMQTRMQAAENPQINGAKKAR